MLVAPVILCCWEGIDPLENAAVELERFFVEEDYFEYDTPLFGYLYASDEL